MILEFESLSQLEPCDLIAESYLKLAGFDGTVVNERHFLSLATSIMRRHLIEEGRFRNAWKRSPDSFDMLNLLSVENSQEDTVLINDIFFMVSDSRMRRVIIGRHLLGLTLEEVADTLSISYSTVARDYVKAMNILRSKFR